jgi:hypothetical protein
MNIHAACKAPPCSQGGSSSSHWQLRLQPTEQAVIEDIHGCEWHSFALSMPWHCSSCAQQQPAVTQLLVVGGVGGAQWKRTLHLLSTQQ